MFRGEEGLGAPLNAIVIFSNRGRDNEGESIGNNMENNSTEDPGIQHSSSGSTENRTGALGVNPRLLMDMAFDRNACAEPANAGLSSVV